MGRWSRRKRPRRFAPNPQAIAEAVATLIATPKGQRAARTVVGASYGSDTLNEATAPVQAQVIDALGLSHLTSVRTA